MPSVDIYYVFVLYKFSNILFKICLTLLFDIMIRHVRNFKMSLDNLEMFTISIS